MSNFLCFLFFPDFVYSKNVRNIEILKIGIAYEGYRETEKEGGKLFKPTKEQIVNFFEKAKELEYGGSSVV